MKNLFWQRWWMVFDEPKCNNFEVSLYFLRKVYYEFVLNVLPNYFDMREFHGRGGDSTQDRPGARSRVAQESRHPLAPKPKVHLTVPVDLKESIELQTLQAATTLTNVIIQHGTQLAHPLVPDDESLVVAGGASEPIQHLCATCSGICTGTDDEATADGSTSHSCMICGSRCQTCMAEDVALTDELMDMLFGSQSQTQDAATIFDIPPTITAAATSTPETSEDQMSQIDDVTLSAIDFGLQGYTGTPSISRPLPQQKNSSRTPKCGKKIC
ncbi:uncharacterized protein LOC131042511 isoform X2 [Cryptomeria japonica]|uniref:uncharacterized protein LOC131042511 isoform X2 n=1 Tax=Cryptomeria japonica TaxID=3369 RepID=UPI0027D9D027|nr:uncharacterized protein LOC131042511 isoform X2 [Cryptomeria japonica]